METTVDTKFLHHPSTLYLGNNIAYKGHAGFVLSIVVLLRV